MNEDDLDEQIDIDPPNADGSIDVEQIPLLAAIWKHLAAFHGKDLALEPRQMNATIEAANLIVDELRKPVVKASSGMGLEAWWNSDDTGTSSKYLAGVLSDRRGRGGTCLEGNHPHDPSDLGRCLRMLDAAPELRENMPMMSDPIHGPVWNALFAHWNELESLYREELPSGNAPRCYERMKQIIEAAAK